MPRGQLQNAKKNIFKKLNFFGREYDPETPSTRTELAVDENDEKLKVSLDKLKIKLNNVKENSPPLDQDEFTTDKESKAFAKIISKNKEIKVAVEDAKKAYSEFKLTQFFHFDSTFIKEYSQALSQFEKSVELSDKVLEEYNKRRKGKDTLPQNKTPTQIRPLDKIAESFNDNDAKVVDNFINNCVPLLKPTTITPPSSEVGSEDRGDLSNEPPQVVRRRYKRKFTGIIKLKRKKRKIDRENSIKAVDGLTRDNPPSKAETDLHGPPNSPKSSSEIEPAVPSTSGTSTQDQTTKEPVEFEVDKVKNVIRKQSGYFFQVSWKGYSEDEDTYEPEEHLEGCDEILISFFIKRLAERENVTDPERFKNLLLPSDLKYKSLLYESFKRFLPPMTKETRHIGVQAVVSNKQSDSFKSVEEIEGEILKLVAIRDPNNPRYTKLYKWISSQIKFREIYQERQKQLADLRCWENSMNTISSEPARLTVENNVDLELPPIDFVYINHYKPGPNIVIPNEPVAGCQCTECGMSQKACCPHNMGSHFAYNKFGKVRVTLGTAIYECNKACSCPPSCCNRVVQRGRQVSLAIFRTSNGRGWGVRALELIKKDQFVTEYVGEVITSEEAERRGVKYDNMSCTYLFDLDYNKGDQNPYTVDAYKYGNVSHFINHSCDPNLAVFNVWVDCLDPDLPKLALFAVREIKKGEEITFDYNSCSTRQLSITDKIEKRLALTPSKRPEGSQMEDEEGNLIIPTSDLLLKTPKNNSGKTECRCGAANCRGFFF